jgi:hypothetical protein
MDPSSLYRSIYIYIYLYTYVGIKVAKEKKKQASATSSDKGTSLDLKLGSSVVVVDDVPVNYKFTLEPEAQMYLMSIEMPVIITTVALYSNMPLDLVEAKNSHTTTTMLSRSPVLSSATHTYEKT